MKTMKKGIALVLALMMVLGLGAFSVFAAATDLPTPVDGVITLDNDVTLASTKTIANGETVTLDLNGHTITSAGWVIQNQGTLTIRDSEGTGGIVSTGNCGVNSIGSGSTLTIESGSITAQEAAVMAFDGATITINGGTFTAIDNFVIGTNGSTGRGNNTITINAGTFNGGIQSAGYVACGIYAANNDTWNINGGTFNITGGAGIVARAGEATVSIGDGVTFNVSGTVTGKVGDAAQVVPCAPIVFDSKSSYPGLASNSAITINGGVFTCDSSVAAVQHIRAESDPDQRITINGGTFSDLSALDFAADNATIKLANGVELTETLTIPANKTVTLDLNGQTLNTSAGDGLWLEEDANLTITDSSTAKTGKIIHTGAYDVMDASAGSVTLEAGTLESSATYGVIYSGNLTMTGGALISKGAGNAYTLNDKHTATISGGTISAENYGIAVFGSSTLNLSGDIEITAKNAAAISTNGSADGENFSNAATINISGGTFTSTNDGAAYAPSATWNVSGGTFTGATAFYAKGGKVTISDGTFIANGEKADFVHSGNGWYNTGDAFVAESCNYPYSPATLSVTGGNFTSENAEAVAAYSTDAETHAAASKFVTGGTFNTTLDTALIADGYAQRSAGYGFAEGQVVSDTAYTNAVNAYYASPYVPTTPTTPTTEPEETVDIGEDEVPLADLPEGVNQVLDVSQVTVEIDGVEMPLAEVTVPFADVENAGWEHDAIAYVQANELMTGTDTASFSPSVDSTRGMVATILYRLADGQATSATSFADVGDTYYAEAAAWSKENGVFSGDENGNFNGGTAITREQLVSVLYRYAVKNGYDVSGAANLSTYADGANVSEYAATAMAWAIKAGLIQGDNGLLNPTATATRVQLAAILMRFCENVVK